MLLLRWRRRFRGSEAGSCERDIAAIAVFNEKILILNIIFLLFHSSFLLEKKPVNISELYGMPFNNPPTFPRGLN